MPNYTTDVKPYKGIGMEGAIAKWYAGLTKKWLDDFKALARRIAAELAPGSKVLEVAPGPGYLAIELAKSGKYQVTGLDISQTFVEIARANAAKANVQVEFRRGNASRMPFEDATFDFLVCSAAFKNFTQPVQALREMYRVLKPSGQALIIDLRRDASIDDIRQAVDGRHVGAINGFITKLTFRLMLLKRAYTKAEFEQLARHTRFERVEIRESLISLEGSLGKSKEPAEKNPGAVELQGSRSTFQ
jgi:ubiquinone/menaquinone biosynthesis C-methylase UbiE